MLARPPDEVTVAGEPADTAIVTLPDRRLGLPATGVEHEHELLYRSAMERIEGLAAEWREAVDGSTDATRAEVGNEPTREMTALPGVGPVDVLAARAAAPRWRRGLVEPVHLPAPRVG